MLNYEKDRKGVKENLECSYSIPSQEKVVRQGRNYMQWLPPPVDVIKLNADASYNQSSQMAGLRIMARNDQGGYV